MNVKNAWSVGLVVLGLGQPVVAESEQCCPAADAARRATACCPGEGAALPPSTQAAATPGRRIAATVTLPHFAVSAGPGRAIAAGFALLALGILVAGSWLTIAIARAVTLALAG